MKIGELAAKTAMAPSAIRFYEQSGLLPPVERGANGYRVYSEVVLERLLVIQMAQNLGFSLDAMRSVFANNKGFPQAELLARLDTRLTKQPPTKVGGFVLRTESPDTRRLNDAS
jgi:MerR family copper efflux transcriptional regulator